MGFFIVEGSDDYGKTWQEETTEPAKDLRHATVLLRQDLSRTASSEMAVRTLMEWDKGKGTAIVSDSGRTLNLDPHQWRFRFEES